MHKQFQWERLLHQIFFICFLLYQYEWENHLEIPIILHWVGHIPTNCKSFQIDVYPPKVCQKNWNFMPCSFCLISLLGTLGQLNQNSCKCPSYKTLITIQTLTTTYFQVTMNQRKHSKCSNQVCNLQFVKCSSTSTFSFSFSFF